MFLGKILVIADGNSECVPFLRNIEPGYKIRSAVPTRELSKNIHNRKLIL